MRNCHFCGQPQSIVTSTGVSLSTLISENHWAGNGWVRVDHCSSCTVAKPARKPRAPRRTHVAATDWNMLVMSTKGNR